MARRTRRESPGRWLSMIHRATRSHLGRLLAPHRIGPGQVAFLMRLFRRDGVTQEELAAELRMDKGATARALDRLERNGYVERRNDEADARVKRVFLTAEARERKPSIRRALRSWNEALLDGFAPAEREAVLALLRRMADNAARAIDQDRNEEEA